MLDRERPEAQRIGPDFIEFDRALLVLALRSVGAVTALAVFDEDSLAARGQLAVDLERVLGRFERLDPRE